MTAILKNRIANAAGTNIADVNGSGQLAVIGSFTLPTGASTEAKQDTEITALGTLNTSVNTLLKPADTLTKVTTVDTITNPVAVTGTFFPATQPVSAASLPLPTGAATETTVATLLTDTQLRATPVPVSGTITTGGLTDTELRASPVPVSATVLPLPTGASTSALQTTGNTSLSSIDTKTPVLGQALMVASTPVVIASNQSAIPVSGTVTTGGLTDTQLRATPVPVSLTSTTISNFPATQTVSGTVTANLGTIAGVSTETTLSALNLKIPTSLTVVGNRLLTDNSGVTQPVSATALPLPTGAATSALQTTGNTALATLDTSVNTLLKPASTLAAVTTVGTVNAVTAITNALPTGANTIGNTNQTLATAEFAKITDGTETVEVTPATTVPVVANPALVVSLSPNVSTVATAIAKAEDAVHSTGDVGVMMLGVRDDIVSSKTSLSGDYSPITTDSAGRMVTTPMASRSARLHQQITLTTTTEATIIPAAAGFFNDIVNIVVGNLGAGNETVVVRSGTAGTILMQIASLANTSQTMSFAMPIPATAVNLPITCQLSSAAATGVSIGMTVIRNI